MSRIEEEGKKVDPSQINPPLGKQGPGPRDGIEVQLKSTPLVEKVYRPRGREYIEVVEEGFLDSDKRIPYKIWKTHHSPDRCRHCMKFANGKLEFKLAASSYSMPVCCDEKDSSGFRECMEMVVDKAKIEAERKKK